MAIAKLSIDIEARLASLQQDLGKAATMAETAGRQISAAFEGVKSVMGALGIGLAASEIIAFSKSTIDGVAALAELRAATGASVENLSALEDIAMRGGHSMESAGDAVIKLNKALLTASDKPDSVQARAIEAIGLSVKDLMALDPVEALQKLAIALDGFADTGSKGRIEMALLGKGTKELAPLFEELAKAGKLNSTVTTQQAEEAKKFNDQLASMHKNTVDLARSFASVLVPAMSDFLAKLNEASKNKKTWDEIFGLPQEQGPDPADRIRALEKLLASETLTQERRIRLQTQLAALQAKTEFKSNSSFEKTAASWGGGKPTAPDPEAKVKREKADKPDFFGPLMPDALKDAMKTIEGADISKVIALKDQLRELISMKEAGGGGPGISEAMLAVQEQLDKLDPSLQAAAEAKKKLDSILAATPTGVLQDVLQDIELINSAFAEGKIGVEQWAEAMRDSTAKLRKGAEDMKPAIDEMTVWAEQAARNIQDALGNTIEQTLRGNFDNIGQMWGDLLLKMAAEAMAAQIGNTLFGDMGKSGWGVLGSIFDLAITGKAVGGPVSAGTPYLVGEKGPELFMPSQSGTIVPNGAGGGIVINNSISVGDGVSISQVASAMAATERKIKSDIQRSQRRGGAFSQ